MYYYLSTYTLSSKHVLDPYKSRVEWTKWCSWTSQWWPWDGQESADLIVSSNLLRALHTALLLVPESFTSKVGCMQSGKKYVTFRHLQLPSLTTMGTKNGENPPCALYMYFGLKCPDHVKLPSLRVFLNQGRADNCWLSFSTLQFVLGFLLHKNGEFHWQSKCWKVVVQPSLRERILDTRDEPSELLDRKQRLC